MKKKAYKHKSTLKFFYFGWLFCVYFAETRLWLIGARVWFVSPQSLLFGIMLERTYAKRTRIGSLALFDEFYGLCNDIEGFAIATDAGGAGSIWKRGTICKVSEWKCCVIVRLLDCAWARLLWYALLWQGPWIRTSQHCIAVIVPGIPDDILLFRTTSAYSLCYLHTLL